MGMFNNIGNMRRSTNLTYMTERNSILLPQIFYAEVSEGVSSHPFSM